MCKVLCNWFCGLDRIEADCQARLSDLSIQLAVSERNYQNALKALDSTKAKLTMELNQCMGTKDGLLEQIEKLELESSDLEDEIENLKQQIENLKQPSEASKYYNKFDKITRVYEKRYVVDEYSKKTYIKAYPQEFVGNYRNYEIQNLVGAVYNLYHPITESDKVRAALAYVRSNPGLGAVYRSDDYYGTPYNDFWQKSDETVVLRKGDCEDLAMLWYDLCRAMGVPEYKIYIGLGFWGQIGHAYGVYYPTESSSPLLIEATQIFPYETGQLTTLESHSEYRLCMMFNEHHLFQIIPGYEFGKLVETIQKDWKARVKGIPTKAYVEHIISEVSKVNLVEGAKNIIVDVKDWVVGLWENHHSTRKFVMIFAYGGVVAVASYAEISLGAADFTQLPKQMLEIFPPETIGVLSIAIVAAVHNWAKHNKESLTATVTGKKVATKKKR